MRARLSGGDGYPWAGGDVRLQGARAVVTGGASGLGLAVAERLVELGARVVVLDLRPPVAFHPEPPMSRPTWVPRPRPTVPWPRRSMCSGAHGRRLLCRDLPSRAGSGQGKGDGADGLRARRDGQSNQHLPSVPRRGHCHAAQRSGTGWGTWRHREYRLHRRLRWTDRAGRLCRLQGRGGKPDLAAGPRIRELRGQGRLHRPGVFETPMVAPLTGRARPGGPAEPAAVPQTLRGPGQVRGTGLSHLRKSHAERRGDPARWGLEDECEIAHDPSPFGAPPRNASQRPGSPVSSRASARRRCSTTRRCTPGPSKTRSCSGRPCGAFAGSCGAQVGPGAQGGDRMPGARWFPGATLNFAENLMGAADLRPALVFRAESGERRELSRAEYVGSGAGSLRGCGPLVCRGRGSRGGLYPERSPRPCAPCWPQGDRRSGGGESLATSSPSVRTPSRTSSSRTQLHTAPERKRHARRNGTFDYPEPSE